MAEQVCLHNRAFKENEPPAPKVITMVRSLFTLPKLSNLRNVGVLRWWPHYTLDKFYGDLSAATTVSVVLVPQGMAYALLAGLPPVYGLYSSTIPVILFGLITSSASVAPGPVAPTAIVMNAMVSSMTSQPPLSSEFVRIHLALAFVTGMFQLGLGVLQQTWVSDLVSYPVMNGFAFGAALIICASQLGDLFGLTVARATGFFDRIGAAGRAAGTWNWRTTLLSLGCLYILLQFRTWSIRGYALPKRFPMPLAIICAITLVSYAVNLEGRGGIRLVGPIPSQFPGATIPIAGASDIALVASNAAILAVINFMQSVSLAKIFGKKLEEETVPELEMFALGVSSVVGSCMSCYTIAGSFTRTTVQFEAGARTPATTILTGAIMVVFLFTITRILNFLPMCVLAAVVMTSTRQLFATDVALELWRSKRSDFVQFAVTVLAVLVLDIVYGLLVGIAFSLFLILARSFLPNLWELGRLPNTDSFVALSRFPEAQTVPGFKVLRLAGELHFGNVRRVADKMARLLREAKESRLLAVTGGGGGGGVCPHPTPLPAAAAAAAAVAPPPPPPPSPPHPLWLRWPCPWWRQL